MATPAPSPVISHRDPQKEIVKRPIKRSDAIPPLRRPPPKRPYSDLKTHRKPSSPPSPASVRSPLPGPSRLRQVYNAGDKLSSSSSPGKARDKTNSSVDGKDEQHSSPQSADKQESSALVEVTSSEPPQLPDNDEEEAEEEASSPTFELNFAATARSAVDEIRASESSSRQASPAVEKTNQSMKHPQGRENITLRSALKTSDQDRRERSSSVLSRKRVSVQDESDSILSSDSKRSKPALDVRAGSLREHDQEPVIVTKRGSSGSSKEPDLIGKTNLKQGEDKKNAARTSGQKRKAETQEAEGGRKLKVPRTGSAEHSMRKAVSSENVIQVRTAQVCRPSHLMNSADRRRDFSGEYGQADGMPTR